MSTSAEERRGRPPAEAGFTLLEILATLAIVALAIVPMLGLRDRSWSMAYRSGHLLRAANYAQTLLADRMSDPERVKDLLGQFDDDPSFRYEMSLEDYDLSSGRVLDDEEQQGFSQATKFSTMSAFAPADAALPAGPLDEDSPHRVRRVRITIWYEDHREDSEEPARYVVEGFIPRATETPPGGKP